MQKIYAQIKSNRVHNIIVLEDETLAPLFSDGFDLLIDVTEMRPYPSPNWAYIEGTFYAPPDSNE